MIILKFYMIYTQVEQNTSLRMNELEKDFRYESNYID